VEQAEIVAWALSGSCPSSQKAETTTGRHTAPIRAPARALDLVGDPSFVMPHTLSREARACPAGRREAEESIISLQILL
jgi:hypothetical protein